MDVEPGVFSIKGARTTQSSTSGHTYVNADHDNVRSSGKLSPSSDTLHRDKSSSADVHQSKKSAKPQSPPNSFIFPSTFQGSAMDAEVRTSIGESLFTSSTNGTTLSEQSPTKQYSSTGGSPREHVITQSDALPKHDHIRDIKQDIVNAIPDDDLRPEVAKLPGRKRVASWGTVQEDATPVNNGPAPSVKPKPSKDYVAPSASSSDAYSDQQRHPRGRLANGDHTDGVTSPGGSGNAANSNSAEVQTKVHLYNQLSDASSESSSPSESRRSSVSKNRKSWDGVRHPGESEENQKVSRLERKDNKERSCSDSNLMVRNIQLISTFIIWKTGR